MFAALNNVRNHWNLKPLENRGIPDDLGNEMSPDIVNMPLS